MGKRDEDSRDPPSTPKNPAPPTLTTNGPITTNRKTGVPTPRPHQRTKRKAPRTKLGLRDGRAKQHSLGQDPEAAHHGSPMETSGEPRRICAKWATPGRPSLR